MITLEKILGALTGKENLYRCGRNFTAIEEALNNVSVEAADIAYDNTTSGMTATDVQAAVDELRTQNNSLDAQVNSPDYTPILKRQEPVFAVGTGYDSNNVLQDLKSSIIKGQVPINAKGLSIVNLLGTRGNCDSMTDWSNNGSIDTTIKLFGTGSIKHVATGAQMYDVTDGIQTLAGKYYFASAHFYVASFTDGGIALSISDYGTWNNQQVVYADSSKINRWQRIGLKLSRTTLSRLLIGQVANGTSVSYVDGITLHEITIDEYNKLTVDQLMKKYPYHDGLQGVNNVVVKSVGKNLVDLPSIFTQNLPAQAVSKRICTFKVKPNTDYRLSGTYVKSTGVWGNGGVEILGTLSEPPEQSQWFAETYVTGSVALHRTEAPSEEFNKTFNSGNFTCVSIYLGTNYVDTTFTLTNIQIEESTVITPYEHYVESISEIPTALHSLPNGVKDEIVDGKLVKRIAEYTLVASDITLFTNMTNVTAIGVNLPSDYVGSGTDASVDKGSIIIDKFVWKAWSDALANVNTFHYVTDTTPRDLGLVVAKGTYTDLAAAQTALAGTKLVYQLAIPIVEDLATPLTVFPNGTISVESGLETTMPELSFAYPLDMVSVIARLNEAVNQNAKLIQDKADKKQGNWLYATLQSGWAGTLKYRKNSIGQVEIVGEIKPGSMYFGAYISTMPVGYRPISDVLFTTIEVGTGYVNTCWDITSDGSIQIYEVDQSIGSGFHRFNLIYPAA